LSKNFLLDGMLEGGWAKFQQHPFVLVSCRSRFAPKPKCLVFFLQNYVEIATVMANNFLEPHQKSRIWKLGAKIGGLISALEF